MCFRKQGKERSCCDLCVPRRVMALLASEFGIEQPAPSQSLLDAGLLDSMAIAELVLALESTFRITLTEEDLLPEHFQSPSAIADLVRKRQSLPIGVRV